MPQSQSQSQFQFQSPQNKDFRFTPEELLKAPKKAKNSKVHPDTDNSHNHAARQLNF
jgi:hypothetical protein